MLSEIIHAARVVYLTVLIHDIGEGSTILRYIDFRNRIVRMQAYKQLSEPFRIDLPPSLRILSILWEDTLNILKRFTRFMSNTTSLVSNLILDQPLGSGRSSHDPWQSTRAPSPAGARAR